MLNIINKLPDITPDDWIKITSKFLHNPKPAPTPRESTNNVIPVQESFFKEIYYQIFVIIKQLT